MATKTYQEQLEEVQAAISSILTQGQSVETAGKTLARATLRTLYDMEQRLRTQVKRESAGGIIVRGATPVDS